MAGNSLAGVLHHIRRLGAVQSDREQADGDLLRRFLEVGDEAAFTVLVERHAPMVLGVCRRALGNDADAEDAFQSTFLVLARKAGSVREVACLASWLHRVARSVAANLSRARRRRERRERHELLARDEAGDVRCAEVRAALDEELGRLPERYRAPLVLCYLQGRTRDEAAERLGLTPGALHGRLERGRRLLCDRLTRRGLTFAASLVGRAAGEGAAQAALSPAAILSLARAAGAFARGETPVVSAHVLTLAHAGLQSAVVPLPSAGAKAILSLVLLLTATAGAITVSSPAQDAKATPGSTARAPGNEAKRAEDPAAHDARSLQGEWQVVEAEARGKKTSEPEVTELRLVFQKDEIILRSADDASRLRKLKYKLIPGTSPRAIDLTPLDGPDQGKPQPAIYVLDNDLLKLCQSPDGGKRPTDFTTREGDGKIVMVLEKVGGERARARAAAGKQPADEAAAEWAAIRLGWEKARREFWEAYGKVITLDERRRLTAERNAKQEPLARRCLKLAEAHPDHPAALAALFWAAGTGPDSDSGKQARARLQDGRIARAGLEELFDAIEATRPEGESMPELAPPVLERVKKELGHKRSARLLVWVCAQYYRAEDPDVPPPFAEAARLIVDRFPDHPDICNFCECLAPVSGTPPPWAGRYERDLRVLLDKNRHRLVRVTAQFALASVVAADEARQEEAARLFEQLLKDFDGSDSRIAGVEKELIRLARKALEEMRLRAVGKPAPEIEGTDLDGKPLKLSEFRGRVVLLSFWATSCFPCVKLVPHERALVTRLAGKPFALVGVNGDTDAAELDRVLRKHQVNWRSFRDRRADRPAISDEWKILGYPTLYLIDHEGVIRKRWIGSPTPEELNRAIDLLVEKASGQK